MSDATSYLGRAAATTDSRKTRPGANQLELETSKADTDSTKPKKGKDTWMKLLLVYFCMLILVCLIAAVMVWKPTSQSSGTNTTQFIIHPLSSNKSPLASSAIPTAHNTTKTTTTNSSGTTIRNITSSYIGNNLGKESISISFIPSSLVKETRLIELSLLFGVVGSSVYAVTSLTIWQSRNKLLRVFFSWYITRPLIGAALAVTVYLLLRSTLLTTIVNGSQVGGIAFVNDYGVAGISALVGLMTAQVTTKLRDVFDTMFGIQKGTDKGEIDVSEHNITLTPKELDIDISEPKVLVAVVKDSSNNPLLGNKVEFAIVNNKIVNLEGSDSKTDANGMAVLRIKGNAAGTTNVHAATYIGDKPDYASSTVNVKSRGATTKEGINH